MKKQIIIMLGLLVLITGKVMFAGSDRNMAADKTLNDNGGGLERAIFAGGCFWCMEKPFEIMDGVVSVISGYSGGTTADPNYSNYGSGGHIEVVEIAYDPQKVSYQELLEVYWRQVDPTDPGGQFVDRGHSYTTAIFYLDEQQQGLAEASKNEKDNSGIYDKPIVTPILPAKTFYPAEEYHQDYYRNNAVRYHFYRFGSGRDRYLDKIWGKDRK